MKTSKAVTSVSLTVAMFVLPLGSHLNLMLTPQIGFFMLGSLWSLLTQPPVDWQQIKNNSKDDRLTALWIMAAITVGQMVSVFEWAYFHDSHAFCWNVSTVSGILCIISGGALRYESIRTLGNSFTAIVQVSDSQKIIMSGPYKHLRHPSYTGGVLTVLGTPLVLENTYTVFLTLLLILPAYIFRINIEENALINKFGEDYIAYRQNTWKLIPHLW